MLDIGFDVISDLNLDPEDSFNWEGKATSLYCLVAGNVSSDMRTLVQTLAHLGRFYQGVFYTPGTLEYERITTTIGKHTQTIAGFIQQIPNVVLLHHNVAIIDGVAILGANGWNVEETQDSFSDLEKTSCRLEDMAYLYKSVEKLQKHLDVKKILIVTNAVPHNNLYFGEAPDYTQDQIPLYSSLMSDTERKVKHWVFGTYEKTVDSYIDDVNFVNNPYLHKNPYWAKRLTISV